MEFTFRDKRLQAAYEDQRLAIRLWGADAGRRYGDRLDMLRGAPQWATLFTFGGARLHPLHGQRDGRFGMVLAGRWRLILSLMDNTVIVEEVSRHYDD